MMNWSRRTSWSILAVLAALSLASCGGESPDSQSTALDPAAAATIAAQEADPDGCMGEDRQTVAESISDTFDVSYEQVMAWFCDGHEYEDILLALQTSDALDVPADELLAMRAANLSWEEIWDASGLVQETP